MKKDLIDYHICMTSYDTFDLELELEAKGEMFDKILRLSKDRLKKKTGQAIPDIDKNLVESFEVPVQYIKTIKVAIHQTYRKIRDEVSRDGISLLNYEVLKASYTNMGDYWIIKILISGDYVDRR